jgi:hypothetical protein
MMTGDFDIPWPVAYSGFLLGSIALGWATYHVLKFYEARATRRVLAVSEYDRSSKAGGR